MLLFILIFQSSCIFVTLQIFKNQSAIMQQTDTFLEIYLS